MAFLESFYGSLGRIFKLEMTTILYKCLDRSRFFCPSRFRNAEEDRNLAGLSNRNFEFSLNVIRFGLHLVTQSSSNVELACWYFLGRTVPTLMNSWEGKVGDVTFLIREAPFSLNKTRNRCHPTSGFNMNWRVATKLLHSPTHPNAL